MILRRKVDCEGFIILPEEEVQPGINSTKKEGTRTSKKLGSFSRDQEEGHLASRSLSHKNGPLPAQARMERSENERPSVERTEVFEMEW